LDFNKGILRVGMFRTTEIVCSTGFYLNYRHAYGEIKKKQITEIFLLCCEEGLMEKCCVTKEHWIK
jgi:hypothetical protein